MTCPIWGEVYQAKGIFDPRNRMYTVTRSSRAGGGYMIGEVILNSLVAALAPDEKARLTTWVVDQHIQGAWFALITEAVISRVKSRRPLSIDERAKRLLRFMENLAETVSTKVQISPDTHAAYAWSESYDWSDVAYFVDYLDERELIEGNRLADGSFYGVLTVEGHRLIADLSTSRDFSQAFVAMWFDDSMNEAYENGIEPAISEAGYTPLRIDRERARQQD